MLLLNGFTGSSADWNHLPGDWRDSFQLIIARDSLTEKQWYELKQKHIHGDK